MLKEWKSKLNYHSHGGRTKIKRKTTQKLERCDLNIMGMKKKQACIGQRMSGMEEYCIGNQGWQRIVALEGEEKKKEKDKKNKKKKKWDEEEKK